MRVRKLEAGDDRRAFSSGSRPLDDFFKKYAGQNQFEHQIGVTYVAVEEADAVPTIHGYMTIAGNGLRLPEEFRRRLPKYQLPVVLVARLAVAFESAGLGVGRLLLQFAFKVAVAQADVLGCAGVVVDAKAAAVDYYKRFGFSALGPPDANGGETLFLALRHVSRFLPEGAIP